jgi:hypothetical protein
MDAQSGGGIGPPKGINEKAALSRGGSLETREAAGKVFDSARACWEALRKGAL